MLRLRRSTLVLSKIFDKCPFVDTVNKTAYSLSCSLQLIALLNTVLVVG